MSSNGHHPKWEKRFEDQAASGLSAKDFCRQKGIGYSTFLKWKSIHKKGLSRKPYPKQLESSFCKVRVSEPVTVARAASVVRIMIGSMTLEMDRLPTPEWTAEVLRSLRSMS